MSDLIFLALGVAVFAVFMGYAVLLEEGLIMLVTLIYGAAAIGVAIYMVVVLVRPEKF